MISEGVFSSFGIPASVRFDRIDVSNILDVHYVGIKDVLMHWGHFLKDSRTAALVGYFMNWKFLQPADIAISAARIESMKLIGDFIEKGRVCIYVGLFSQTASADGFYVSSFQVSDPVVVCQIHVGHLLNQQGNFLWHFRGTADSNFLGSGLCGCYI